ncbi:unnamed protein product [Cylicocyclus nassatus]|uniref:Uncharacterized protein n=1 Tax=Cylicocyclus nassatus TaxID=53992 RepID=A0AA36H3F2_CYLNA|nr:unnamed protein product [Cylicocyclus nassatus]
MNSSLILLSFFISLVLSESVDPDESPPMIHSPSVIRPHRLRTHHHKREIGQSCGTEICPENTIFLYYRCDRTGRDKCHWYLRMWTIVIFGVVLVKAAFACFVSFFRCVCC